MSPERLHSFVRAWRLFVAATVFLYLVVAAIAIAGYLTNRDRAIEGAQAHAAICVLRGDLQHRVAQSRAFLRSHPHGVSGIPAAVIRNGIRNEQRTIDSLRDLKCERR